MREHIFKNEKVKTLPCAAAGTASDWTRTVYDKSGSRKSRTGKDLKGNCGGPNPHSSTAEKAKLRIDFQSLISKAR